MPSPLERITALLAPFRTDDETFEPTPLLTLEQFFDGNTVEGSIWCNLTDPAGGALAPQQAHAVLRALRDRPEVQDVRVAPTSFDDPEWPFADSVVVVTEASADEVSGWFPADYAPDEVGAADGEQFAGIGVDPGRFRVCWWD